MSKDVKDTEAQEELKDKVNAGDVKEEKETKEKHAKAKKEDKDQKIEELGQKLSEINDKYLRLSAEFDNYRKRTLKERMELTKNAGEQILEKMETAEDVPALREGVELIYANFRDFLSQQGVKEMECLHTDFDPELQEAVTKIPAPAEELKGKVVDCIQKGYTLHDKVIRFPKVVVGE